jgi:DNA-binding transcriptional LysR family regulator
MDLRVLRTFVAVAEQRHFARAASLCNLSQPAVSHQIALLEDEIGTRLFNRASRHVSLTVAGEVLLEEARRILAAIDRAYERMQEVVRGAVGRIRLGATPTPGLYLLPQVIAEYRVAHEAYDLRLEIAAAHEIAERVAQNDLDMAVLGAEPPTTELQMRTLARDEFVIVAHPRSAIVRAHSVKPSRLDVECWLIREDGSETRKALAGWWHRHRLAPSRTMVFDGPEAVKRAVMASLGIAMTSRLTVADDLTAGRLAMVNVSATLPTREFFVVDHPQKHHGAACRAMLQLFNQRFPTAATRNTATRTRRSRRR